MKPLNSLRTLVLIGLPVMVAGCSAAAEDVADQSTAVNSKTTSYVRTATVQAAQTSAPLPFSGTVRAADNAPLAFQTSGRLEKRPAQLGQSVKSGDVLAVLDNPQLKPALTAAEARVRELNSRLAQARRDVQRVSALLRSGSATTEEVEQVRANRDALEASAALAEAERKRSEQLLNETTLRAPFAGQISAVFIEPGQIVSPGQPVVSLSGAEGLEIEIGVPARLLNLLKPGLEVPVSQFNRPMGINGVLSRVAQTSSAGQLNRVVVMLPSDQRLHAGMTVSVALPSTQSTGLMSVPVRAVLDTGRGVPRVFRYKGGLVESLTVELHRVLGDSVLISGPLAAGDQLVIAGLAGLQDGQPVKLLD